MLSSSRWGSRKRATGSKVARSSSPPTTPGLGREPTVASVNSAGVPSASMARGTKIPVPARTAGSARRNIERLRSGAGSCWVTSTHHVGAGELAAELPLRPVVPVPVPLGDGAPVGLKVRLSHCSTTWSPVPPTGFCSTTRSRRNSVAEATGRGPARETTGPRSTGTSAPTLADQGGPVTPATVTNRPGKDGPKSRAIRSPGTRARAALAVRGRVPGWPTPAG